MMMHDNQDDDRRHKINIDEEEDDDDHDSNDGDQDDDDDEDDDDRTMEEITNFKYTHGTAAAARIQFSIKRSVHRVEATRRTKRTSTETRSGHSRFRHQDQSRSSRRQTNLWTPRTQRTKTTTARRTSHRTAKHDPRNWKNA